MGILLAVKYGAKLRWLWRNAAVLLLTLSTLLCPLWGTTGCGSTASAVVATPKPHPHDRLRTVCWKPSELSSKRGDHFVIPGENGVAISEDDAAEFSLGMAAGGFIYKYDVNAPVENLRLLPLSRVDAWCTRIPKPIDKDVREMLEVCPEATSMEEGRSAAKNVLGQTEGVSIRSPYLCGQEPQTSWTTEQLILHRNKNTAFQKAYDYAHDTAMALTIANAEMQAVISKDSSWLKRQFTADPGTVEQIQQRVANALNSIQPPPEYDDKELNRIALLGFDAGFANGQFEVEAKLFAIDAGVVLLEFAAMEVALGPLGGAKFLASAVSKGGRALTQAAKRLENIPIFIPGAAGGPGGFIRIGKVVNTSKKALSKLHAKALEDALKAAGFEKKTGESTHHIVAHSSEVDGADQCRRLFAQFKLEMNAEYNGAFLPWTTKSPNPAGALVHQTLDNKVYYRKLADALGKAKSQTEAINMLKRVRETLRNGTFYHANF